MVADRLRRPARRRSAPAATAASSVTLHESHVAWASYERCAVTDRPRRRCPTASTTRRGPAAATSTTAGSATASPPRLVGARARRPGHWPWAAVARGSASPRSWRDPRRRARAGRRADRLGVAGAADPRGRPAAARRAAAHAARRRLAPGRPRERARAVDARRRSSRPASGPGAGCSSTTASPPDRVHVAEPGVDPAPLAPGTAAGGRLLCVGAVDAGQGARRAGRPRWRRPRRPAWRCTCVGSLDLDPGFVDRLRAPGRRAGIADGSASTGPLTGAELDAAYAAADLLVLASRAETYGMVVTEALARGLPVVATRRRRGARGARPRTDGARPGLLVPPDDPTALAARAALLARPTPALAASAAAAARERRHDADRLGRAPPRGSRRGADGGDGMRPG